MRILGSGLGVRADASASAPSAATAITPAPPRAGAAPGTPGRLLGLGVRPQGDLVLLKIEVHLGGGGRGGGRPGRR